MKKFVCLLLVTLSLIACSQDDLIKDDLPEGAIGFSDGMLTRGTPVENAGGILSMGVFCGLTEGLFVDQTSNPANYMNNVNVSRKDNATAFSYSPLKYWPVDNTKKLSFFAYAPHSSTLPAETLTFTSTGGTPDLTYTVPTDVTIQPDLVVAAPKKNLTKSDGRIDFAMKHVLTCIGFKIAGQGEKVTSIKIKGISTTGTLGMDVSGAINWTGLNSPQTTIEFTAGTKSGVEATDAMTDIMNGNGYLMMIPQTLGQDAKLSITLDNGKTKEVSLSGRVWAAGTKVGYGITLTPDGTIVIDPENLYLPSTAVSGKTDNIEVIYTPDSETTTSDTDQKWTLSSADSWLSLSLTENGVGASSVSGSGSRKVYVSATANTGNDVRTTTLSINRRPENVVCNVTQLKSVDFSSIVNGGTVMNNSYVGAFWKANQKGERIINIPVTEANSGAWSAYIAWTSGDWKVDDIKLSNAPTKDSGVEFNNENALPGDAELYPVTGDHTAVGGVVEVGNNIYFRIGLNSTFTPSKANPVRYAVVILSYKNNTVQQKIFLRQGHDPDYLMRSEDEYKNTQSWASAPTWRPSARKFSPYNLTAANMENNEYITLAVHGGVFVDYPTQTGAYFQWAGTTGFERRAYHPTKTITRSDWSSVTAVLFWDDLAATHEISPINYTLSYGTGNFRRPNDGATNGAANGATAQGSEMRQSLFMSPEKGFDIAVDQGSGDNTTFGYYADGYFDRRTIISNTTVAKNTVNVAYKGRLFFNPENNASLFFPSSGSRDYLDGSFKYVGSSGYFLTSSAVTKSNATILAFGGYASDSKVVSLYMTSRDQAFAYSIRSVLDE